MLIDTHCHLNLRESFADPEVAVTAAAIAGVERLIVVGIDAETSRYAVDLANRFAGVFATVGWHPTSTAGFHADWLRPIEELAADPKVVAIGEIGLDYHWPDSSPSDQERALLAQLDLATSLSKPVVYHCRKAYDALLTILERRPQPGLQVLHCFGGDAEAAERAMALDLYFGVDGPITYKNASELRAVVKTVPADRLVVETDSPFLPPAPFRGKPNSPELLPWVAKALAEVRGMTATQTAEITTANAMRLFGLS
ncbi:MAG: TatD family hydrolase [Fimbriimonadaceae bacterium]